MTYERGLERLERAVQQLDGASGSQCERLAAAWDELSLLGKESAVPAGTLTEIADFERRFASREAIARLPGTECEAEIARIRGWCEHVRAVVHGAAVGDSGPTALERS